MPSSQKPTKNTASSSAREAKIKSKTNQRQTEKPAPKPDEEATELEPKAASERKSGATGATARERKPAASPAGARERKLTPQQQVHLARARRRKLNERLGLGFGALIILVIIAVIIQQAVAKSQADARQAAANATQTALHLRATATAGAKATATENAFAPASPPAVTGTTVTLKDGLQYIDIKVGTGATAKAGDTVKVKYIGWLQDGGTKFDSSYDENHGDTPTEFILGTGTQESPIQGWIEGIPGMKVGGERRLIIPPALAYGAQGSGPIPGNATLIFDVTLVSIGTASS